MSKPITAARETTQRGGLAGAVGLGVIIPAPGADPLDPEGTGWMGPDGYKLEGPVCAGVTRSGERACDGDPAAVPDGDGRFMWGPDSFPFTITAALGCSTFSGDTDLERWHEDTDRKLEMCQWNDIAEELWTGEVARTEGWENRFLASTEAVTLTPDGPVNPVEAFATIEDNLATCTCGGPHLIHVPYKWVAYLMNLSLVTRVGDRLFTGNGSLVIADQGYPGTGPGAYDLNPQTADLIPPAGTSWIYGTSALSARLGPVDHPQTQIAQTIDYRTNRQEVRSTRLAAISWLCCHFAANVDFCSGAPS